MRRLIVTIGAAAALILAAWGPITHTTLAGQRAVPRGESAQKTPERRPPAAPPSDRARPREPQGGQRAVPRDRERPDVVRPVPHVWPPFYGVPYTPWYYPWGYPYPYGFPYSIAPYGSVRLDVDQKDASVLVDGFYVGIVDDFDGPFQRLHLKVGPHRMEIYAAGFETLAAELNILAGRTITYHGRMIPAEPIWP